MKQHLEKMKKLPPLSLAQRVAFLKKLAYSLKSNKEKIIEAVSQDFSHRCQQESQMAEIMVCLDEIKHALKHIKQWTQTRTWHANWKFFPSKCAVYPQAKGVVGIMAPWNYPVNLVIEPLVAAIAAGNRVMIKPSEITPKTSETIKHILSEIFSEDEVYVVLGDVQVADAFSRLPLDHILFTGSTQVGKIVMRNASENLTPLTLELGGKSPVLIDDDYPVMKAAKSIVQGKWFNAGQTCIAPDYILVSNNKLNQLVDAIKQQVTLCYPDAVNNDDYSAVVNPSHLQRLKHLLRELDAGQVLALSHKQQAKENQKLSPTLIINPPTNHPVMEQEIFGPLLPIMTIDNLDTAIAFINQRPNPLTLYLYSNNKKHIQKVRTETRSGSLAINETLVHFAQEGLPFGGIGASGMGSYHGYQGFVAMSHMKSVYYQSRINFNGIVRAPYSQLKKLILRFLS